jgi:hypothetical protein
MLFSTYIGGIEDEIINNIVLDNQDNIIISGETESNNFPIFNALNSTFGGNRDGFISKLSSDGQNMLFSTYFGGTKDDRVNQLSLDNSGNIIISGETSSANFPILNSFSSSFQGGYNDGFISKISSDGQLIIFSTYIGGSDKESINNMKMDNFQNIIISGQTDSEDFPLIKAINPIYGGNQDGFVLKLTSNGQKIVFSTFIGGSGLDIISDMDIDYFGNIIIGGLTFSINFPIQNTFYPDFDDRETDIFVVKLLSGGDYLFGTYYGGAGKEQSIRIGVNDPLSIFIIGSTRSRDFPKVSAFDSYYGENIYVDDGYIAKFVTRSSDVSLFYELMEEQYSLDSSMDGFFDDSDNDGIPDPWEYLMGLNTNINDAQEDNDNDGMLNFWEYSMGLNANDPSDAFTDKDNDWVPNKVEHDSGTSANNFWSYPLIYFNFPFILSFPNLILLINIIIFALGGAISAKKWNNRKQRILIQR